MPTRMKWIIAAAVGVPIIAIAVAAFLAPREGSKSYHFTRVDIDATVQRDGSLLLREDRTFDFHGDFTYAYFTVDHPFEQVRDFQVRDQTGPLQVVEENQAGTYKATWYYQAHDEQRTFHISYAADCAVDVFRDVAHLYWQFVGTGWTEPTDAVDIRVHLPPARQPPHTRPPGCGEKAWSTNLVPPAASRTTLEDQLRAWGHGPLNGAVDVVDERTVHFSVSDVAPGQFVEGSVLFSPDALPDAPLTADRQASEQILAQERRLAEEANRLRARHDIEGWLIRILLGLVPVVMALLVFIAYRRDRVRRVPKILREPPYDDHPVELALLWSTYRKHLAPKTAYRAQFLHLARTGIVDVKAVGPVSDPEDFQLTLRKEPQAEMDRDFVRFLFTGDGKRPLSLKDVRVKGTRKDRLQSWWSAVGTKTKETVKKMVTGRSRGEATIATAVAIGAGVYGYGASFGFGEGAATFKGLVGPWAAALIPVAVASWYVATRLMPPRLSAALRERVARWKAFRRFLTGFSELDDAPALAVIVWERYLEYAVALGVADEVERQVKALIPEKELPPPWPGAPEGEEGYTYYRSWYGSTHAYAPSSAATAVGWTSGWGSSSGGGGGGGGFSGGGGGGGGGTGGGAG